MAKSVLLTPVSLVSRPRFRPRAVSRRVAYALAAVWLIAAVACGGGGTASSPSSPSPSPTPTPPAPSTQPVNFSGTVPAYDIASHALAMTVNGTLTTDLAWTNGTVDLDFYLTDSTCAGYPPADCAILARSVAETGTAEQLTRAVRSGENYILWVDNLNIATAAAYTITGAVR